MNPYAQYKQHAEVGWTRIDMVLALLDGAIDRITKARTALTQNDVAAAKPFLERTQLIIAGLVAGMAPPYDETQINLLRLYEFCLHCVREGAVKDLDGALQTLIPIREGFEGIRAEALQLERSGAITPADVTRAVHASA